MKRVHGVVNVGGIKHWEVQWNGSDSIDCVSFSEIKLKDKEEGENFFKDYQVKKSVKVSFFFLRYS